MPHVHKAGWQVTPNFQIGILKTSTAAFIIIDDSIASGLRSYKRVWKNYFEHALNLSIDGDYVENVLWKLMQDISLPHATSFIIIHCNSSNINQNHPNDISNGIMKNLQKS